MARTPFKRTDRVAAELRREVGLLVHQAVRDSVLPELSVSDVEVTRDFSHATVYFTVLDNDSAGPALAMLKELGREFRMQLARRLRLRTTPELHFRYDTSVEQGERIDRLLRQAGVASADGNPESGADDEPGESPGDAGTAPD
ncbi:MAG: 30S ribosome-binding factor RbfA [Xanthomonadales bacterium]|nr:30S ribosome-binding factor RbfA [Xanthomonadales bacterium]